MAGVRVIANDLAVEFRPGERVDTDLAENAARQPWTVENGWVKLEGTVQWGHERDSAARSVFGLDGVRGVSTLITVSPVAKPEDVERRILSALQRAAALDAKKFRVETIGGRAYLRGTVRSFAERKDAERAAWSVPGVTTVANELGVGSAEPASA